MKLYNTITKDCLKFLPNAAKGYEQRIHIPEFTFLGVKEQPDFGVIRIWYYGNEKTIELKKSIDESFALLFSNLDSFELAAELMNNKTPSKAKAGQEAPADIEIPAGPTDLVPGPAISELGALGIKIQIKDGKIEIKESKIIAKEGEKIKQGAADLMSKLDIKPFSIGFTPIASLDTKENIIYLDIKIDKEKTIEEIKYAFSKALPFAVEIGYANDSSIKLLIGKAGMHEKALKKLISVEKKEESKSEENKEEKIEEPKPEENKTDEIKKEITQTPEENKEEKSESSEGKDK